MNTQFYVPDISGFSEFVNETEIEHGQQITKELLEIIIDSNLLEMEIYEIEGDAIFFFTRGKEYNPDDIIKSSNNILNKFREKRDHLDKHRKCQCGACKTISSLRLKFFVHRDSVNEIKIKHFTKFYGMGLLKIHALMKNSILSKEYLLFTEDYLNKYLVTKDEKFLDYTYNLDFMGEIKVKYVDI